MTQNTDIVGDCPLISLKKNNVKKIAEMEDEGDRERRKREREINREREIEREIDR